MAGALACAAALLTWHEAQLVCRGTEAFYNIGDLWFESDTYRRFQSMLFRHTPWPVKSQHPLFALMTYPPTKVLWSLGLPRLQAIQAVLALGSAVWIATLFWLLRLFGCRPVDAAVFSLLARVSAAATFWWPVPEVFGFGSITLLAPLILVLLDSPKRLSERWYMLISVPGLGLSLTNWMAGLLAAITMWPWRRALRIAVGSIALLLVVSLGQRLFFPTVPPLFGSGDVTSNTQFIFNPVAGGLYERLRSMAVHAMVMPSFGRRLDGATSTITVNMSGLGSGTALGPWAVAVWLILLALGVWASWQLRSKLRALPMLWLLLLGQLGLHVVYGDEMFLYTLHILPLLVVVVALATLTKLRYAALGLAVALGGLAFVNNQAQLREASQLAHDELVRLNKL